MGPTTCSARPPESCGQTGQRTQSNSPLHDDFAHAGKAPLPELSEVPRRLAIRSAATCRGHARTQPVRDQKRLGPGQERKWTEYLFASSVIDTLDDQAAFLRKFLDEEAVQRRRYEEVTQNGRRKPYVWETPMFDEELCNICKEVSAT
jgi:hypothetical protein